MTIQKIMVDGQVADMGEELAEIKGYSSLDRYIMDLIRQDYRETATTISMIKSVYGLEKDNPMEFTDG